MKSVGCCSGWYGRTPQSSLRLASSAQGTPFGCPKGEPIHKLANAVSNKVDRLHQKAPEYQHYRYRQGQQPALASHRRTARNERIPPDGFDMAALEVTLPCLFQGRLCTNQYDSRGTMWAFRPLHIQKNSTFPQHLQSLKSKETATFFRKPASHNCSGIPLRGVSAHACSAASSDAYPYALTVSAMVMHARFFPA